MKQLLYIGHEYHLKTKSTQFLFRIFEKEYEITFLSVDPHLGTDEVDVSSVSGRHFDLLVCLQVMPSINRIRKSVTFDHAAFFPMADYYYGARPVYCPIWKEYGDFHIICFSRKVYDEVRMAGYDAKYLQYFPEPPSEIGDLGNPKGIFFWQRVTDINPWVTRTLLDKFPYDELHMHYAVDPGMRRIEVPDDVKSRCRVTTTSWFEKKEDMLKCMLSKAIYIAPRDIEGIGMSFLEAMANGRCVLAEDNTTMNEYIVHGKTGFLYHRGESLAPLPISCAEDIVTIQKNVIVYMRKGWKRWKIVREKIPSMCTAPIAHRSWLAVGRFPLWFRYWRSLKGYGVEWTNVRTVKWMGITVFTYKSDITRLSYRLSIFKIPVFEHIETPGL